MAFVFLPWFSDVFGSSGRPAKPATQSQAMPIWKLK
jgi:hypothetical protein